MKLVSVCRQDSISLVPVSVGVSSILAWFAIDQIRLLVVVFL